jgi:hypothetical protein
VANLNLAEAFVLFGGKAANRLHSQSAIAADGAMILSCTTGQFGHPAQGVLRYEDRLSREPDHKAEKESLGAHLTLARDGNLPIRMIVVSEKTGVQEKPVRTVHVRPDLIGKVVKFDGDHFIVDFVRAEAPAKSAAVPAKRR